MSLLSTRGVDAASWRFVDLTRGLATRGGATDAEAAAAPAQISSEQLAKIFDAAKVDFRAAGRTMQRLMTLFMLFVGVAITISVAGLIIAAALRAVVVGSAISLAGIATMLGLFSRIHRYGRDQALFEFMISKYEMAFQLSSRDSYKTLLEQFMHEVSVLRDPRLERVEQRGKPASTE